jgi:hypothetical protein
MTISTSFRLPTARIELRESPVTGGRRPAAARLAAWELVASNCDPHDDHSEND